MKKLVIVLIFGISCFYANSQIAFEVDVQNPGADIQPDMYGVFFEDINFGADGGLYAELIKNRSFEFDQPFVGWIPFVSTSKLASFQLVVSIFYTWIGNSVVVSPTYLIDVLVTIVMVALTSSVVVVVVVVLVTDISNVSSSPF